MSSYLNIQFFLIVGIKYIPAIITLSSLRQETHDFKLRLDDTVDLASKENKILYAGYWK